MSKLISELSVFFPAYNEEENIKKTVEAARKVLLGVAKKWEIIVVNDGSRDRTAQIASDLSRKDKCIRVINQENKGYGGAFKTGFSAGKYPWIAFTDSDGQFDFAEITEFIKKAQSTKADLVIGYYKKRQVKKTTIITSKIWEYLVTILFGLKVRDIDCGFKLVSKKVVDEIFPLESERGAFVTSEFLIKAKRSGFEIVEIPVTHYPRTKGKGTGRDIKVIVRSFVDLFKLWAKLNLGF
jgi:glycosyltransferase involved in cell wall biosynthesis